MFRRLIIFIQIPGCPMVDIISSVSGVSTEDLRTKSVGSIDLNRCISPNFVTVKIVSMLHLSHQSRLSHQSQLPLLTQLCQFICLKSLTLSIVSTALSGPIVSSISTLSTFSFVSIVSIVSTASTTSAVSTQLKFPDCLKCRNYIKTLTVSTVSTIP